MLFFDCPQEEMVKRVLNRNEVLIQCILSKSSHYLKASTKVFVTSLQGRLDDNIETVKKRLKIFAALNLPIVDYYKKKGKLHTVSIM